MNFQNESFDLFITQDVFEHVMEQKTFKEIERVLKAWWRSCVYCPLVSYTPKDFTKSKNK